MSHTLSAEAVPSATDHTTSGRFTKGNPGGPGNPFARQTAALRSYLLNHVTEQDLQEILEVLLLNAKGGHLPSIKLLFAYVLGKPKPVVEPDLLDLQEMHMLQQSATPPEALATLCDQLPLDLQVQLARHTQADNAAAAVHTARDAAETAPPTPSTPSTTEDYGEPRGPATVEVPSPNGDYGNAARSQPPKAPSPNGEIRRPPNLTDFTGLSELRRAFGDQATT